MLDLDSSQYKEDSENQNQSLKAATNEEGAISEREKILFCNLFQIATEHFNKEDFFMASETCGRLFTLLKRNRAYALLIDSSQKCTFFMKLLDSTDDIKNNLYPLLCINSIISNNKNSIPYFEENGILNKLSFYLANLHDLSNSQLFLQYSRIIFSCFHLLMNEDQEIRHTFIENEDLQHSVEIIPILHENNDFLSLSYIGFLFSSIIEEITNFDDSPFFEPFLDLFHILLDHEIFDSCFCFFDKLMYFPKTYENLMSMSTTTKIFDVWPKIMELFNEHCQNINKDHDINRIITNSLVVTQKILEATQQDIDLTHFPMNELFEISLSLHPKYSSKALDVLTAYAKKKKENCLEIFEMPFIRLMLQHEEKMPFNCKASYCTLLLYLFNNITPSCFNMLDNDLISFLIDFIDENDDDLLHDLGACLNYFLSNGFDLSFILEHDDKINSFCENDYEGYVFQDLIQKLTNEETSENT